MRLLQNMVDLRSYWRALGVKLRLITQGCVRFSGLRRQCFSPHLRATDPIRISAGGSARSTTRCSTTPGRASPCHLRFVFLLPDPVAGVVLSHDPRLADLHRPPAQVRQPVPHRPVRQALTSPLLDQRLDVPALESPRPQAPVPEVVQRLGGLRQGVAARATRTVRRAIPTGRRPADAAGRSSAGARGPPQRWASCALWNMLLGIASARQRQSPRVMSER